MFSIFPRDVADPKRHTVKNRGELRRWIKERNGKTNCFISVYGLEQKHIDKIFIDIDDSYSEMLKLHKWLKKRKYKHAVFFSGGGYHVYIFTKRQNLKYPKTALRNAQIDITEDADVNADRQVFGDIRRVARIPQTWNPKRRKFCIPLTLEDINRGETYINELAKGQHFVKDIFIGGKLFDLSFYDKEPTFNAMPKWQIDDDLQTMTITKEMIESFAPCILALLKKKKQGHRDRFIIFSYLKDRGLLMEEAIEVARKFFKPDVFYHSVVVEKQPENIWNNDLQVPTCDSLKREGRCAMPEGCTAHLEGSPI